MTKPLLLLSTASRIQVLSLARLEARGILQTLRLCSPPHFPAKECPSLTCPWLSS